MTKSKGRLLSELAEAPKNEDYADVNALPNTGNKVGDQAFVEDTNRLYIWNGTGWYNIALINTSPIWDSGGQPSGSYVLDADSPQDPTTITLAASDPEGLPINYTYVTGGSMDSMATINQDSSVFTITPKTLAQLGEGTYTGSITFRASDGVNILPQISNFTLTFIVSIENSKHTIALFDVTNTSDNNDITDSSTNNHTITVNGDAHAGTFSPYRHGGYSTYFDGNGDYLTISNDASINLANTSFTIECWVFPMLDYSKYRTIFSKRVSGSNTTSYHGYLAISTGVIGFYNGTNYESSTTLVSNAWSHCAWVYDGTNIKIFVNGTQVLSQTVSVSEIDEPLSIGFTRGYNEIFGGYISDFRIVKGTAVYTSNFTPPIARLTAIANTSLLTCHLPYIADGSTNNHAITVNGNTSTRPFGPYDNNEYEVADHGGSVYFDGTGDYLTINDTNIADFGTNDFTIEAWVYCNDTTASQIVDTRPVSTNGAYVTITVQAGTGVYFYTTVGEIFPNGVGTINVNQWHHVAWVRNSGTISIYVDGTSVGSASNSTNFISSNVGIGWNAFIGENTGSVYISDLRIVKDTAIYTSNFTPPTFPLSSSGTSLHLKGTDASIIDKSQRSVLQAVGTVGTTTSVNFAGTKSIDFSTISNDYYVKIPSKNAGGPGFPNLFAAPCTIECWINPTHVQANGLAHKIVWFLGSGITYILFQQENTDNLRLTVRNGGTQFFNQETSNSYKLAANTWQHVCFMSNSGATSCSLYLNGTRVMTGNLSAGLLDPSADNVYFSFGSSGPGTPYAGYASDIKISTYNVYGSPAVTSFTPPTLPFRG